MPLLAAFNQHSLQQGESSKKATCLTKLLRTILVKLGELPQGKARLVASELHNKIIGFVGLLQLDLAVESEDDLVGFFEQLNALLEEFSGIVDSPKDLAQFLGSLRLLISQTESVEAWGLLSTTAFTIKRVTPASLPSEQKHHQDLKDAIFAKVKSQNRFSGGAANLTWRIMRFLSGMGLFRG